MQVARRIIASTRRPWFAGLAVIALGPMLLVGPATGRTTALGHAQVLAAEPHDTSVRTKALSAVTMMGFHPVAPTRLVDTRDTKVPVAAGATLTVSVLGRAGVPAKGVASVVVTLTATGPAADGYLTAYSCEKARPAGSVLSYSAGRTASNMVTLPVGAGGAICVDTLARTHVIVVPEARWLCGGTYFADAVVELNARLSAALPR